MLAVLFILYSAFLIGHAIAARVPDEAVSARNYLKAAADALLLLMLALLLAALGWRLLAIALPVGLFALRNLLPLEQAYAAGSGVMAGIALMTPDPVPQVLLALLLGLVAGTLGKDLRTIAIRSLAQPLAAGATLLIL